MGVKRRGFVLAFVLVLVLVGVVALAVPPALRTYTLKIENLDQDESNCIMWDETGNRICLDKNCDVDCDDAGEDWFSVDDCAVDKGVAAFSTTTGAFSCDTGFTYDGSINELTVPSTVVIGDTGSNVARKLKFENATSDYEIQGSGTDDHLTLTGPNGVLVKVGTLPEATDVTLEVDSLSTSVNPIELRLGQKLLDADYCDFNVDAADMSIGPAACDLTFEGDVQIDGDLSVTGSGLDACDDSKAGVVQISDGAGNFTCSDDWYYSAGNDVFYMEDTATNKQLYMRMNPTGGGTSEGRAELHFGEFGGAHLTDIVDEFWIKSHGDITYEPCCTAADGYGADCTEVNASCAASAGMKVVGDLNILGDISVEGSIFTNSPLKLVSPIWFQDSTRTTYTSASTNVSGDFTIGPAGRRHRHHRHARCEQRRRCRW